MASATRWRRVVPMFANCKLNCLVGGNLATVKLVREHGVGRCRVVEWIKARARPSQLLDDRNDGCRCALRNIIKNYNLHQNILAGPDS